MKSYRGRTDPSRLGVLLSMALLIGTSAQAQATGGHGHGGGGRGGRSPSGSSSAPAPDSAPTPRPVSTDQIEIVGVIRAIEPADDRVTIAYEPVEALNWPAGSMPFVVASPTLLKTATVGEKVRFKLDSEQISDLRPF